jgi:hypothetical protein
VLGEKFEHRGGRLCPFARSFSREERAQLLLNILCSTQQSCKGACHGCDGRIVWLGDDFGSLSRSRLFKVTAQLLIIPSARCQTGLEASESDAGASPSRLTLTARVERKCGGRRAFCRGAGAGAAWE